MKRGKVFLYGGLVFGVAMVYLLAAVVVPKVFVSLTKAAPAGKASLGQSYVLGQKLLAKADGKDVCRVNVFVLDETGKGVKGRMVELVSEGLEPRALSDRSDGNGEVGFEIKSVKEGQFELTAMVDGVEMTQKIKVTFRN